MTTFRETPSGSGGHINRLVWSAPDPPQGHILYYNARISSTGSGQVLVPFVTEIFTTDLDVRLYTSLDEEYNVEVFKLSYTTFLLSTLHYFCHF